MGKKSTSNAGSGGPKVTAKNQELELTSQRYSDGELKEFEILINKKIRDMESQLESSKGEDLSELKPWEKENVLQMRTRTENQLTELNLALTRIQNKTYGVCVVTGKLIPKQRLRVQPTATKSVEAERLGSQASQSPGFDNFQTMATEDDEILIPHQE